MNPIRFIMLPLLLLTSVPTWVVAAELPITVNRGARDDTFINVTTDTATTALAANRSYSCEVLNREYDAELPKRFPVFSPTVTGPTGAVTAKATGTMKPGVAVPSNIASVQDNMRLSLIAPVSGNYTFSFTEAQTGGTAPTTSTVRCNDTTLYGGFNRFFGNIVIVELTNETSETLKPFITIVDTAGNVLVDKVFPAELANTDGVTPEGRADIIFADLPANTFGQVIVTYEGSLGALTGYIAEYDFDGRTLTLKRERAMDTTPILP